MKADHFKSAVTRFLEKHFASSVMTVPQLVGIILPLLLEQILLRIINVLNSTMVSSYGAEAVSAVSMVDSLNFMTINFFIAVATGCTVVVAQYYGRRDRQNAALTAAQAVTSSVLLAGLIGAVLLIFTEPIIGLLFGQGDPLFQSYCSTYLRASAISYPFFAIIQTGVGAMRGSGNTKASLVFSTALNLLNILFNYVFLFVFRLGIVGISISVISCRVLVAIIILVYMLRSNDEYPLKASHFLKPILHIQRSVFVVAVPNGLEQAFFYGGRMLTQIFIVGFGTMSIAANAVAFNYSSLIQIFGGTMQLALVTIAGQCIGAGRVDLAKWYIKKICYASVAGSILLSLLLGGFLPLYLKLYALPDEANQIAMNLCLLGIVTTILFWTPSFVPPSGLRAAGDGTYTSVAALISMWVVRVILGYILGVQMGFGVYGVYAAMYAEWPFRTAFFLLRLRGDRWYRHKVIQDDQRDAEPA